MRIGNERNWGNSPPSRRHRALTMKAEQPRKAPIAALFILLLPVFLPDLFSPFGSAWPALFTEWNAPEPAHLQLLEGALQRDMVNEQFPDLWSPLSYQGWQHCHYSFGATELPTSSQGYIQVFLDGGLNQQRMSICDAVAVAKILNATLVVPHFDVNPVWLDSSSFEDIFDVDHFISILENDVSIVKCLPKEYAWSTREYYATGIRATRVKTAPLHASPSWYLENVLPIMQRYGIAAISPFSHRLAFENMSPDIQRLRCKVNFQALTFVSHINTLGTSLIRRLRSPNSEIHGINAAHLSNDRSSRKYVVVHLRFDKDMAAHSACDFGGGRAEKLALAKYRELIWQGRVLNSRFTSAELRSQGRCPLTPEEVGLLLAALGFDNSTRLYLASHKVYGGEARLLPLQKLFPLLDDKKSLTTDDERAKVDGKASVLAAIDYFVSLQSDVFISASPGNMHNALIGHRTYENLKTIRPNMMLLGKLFINKTMAWPDFVHAVHEGHQNRLGQVRLRKPKQSIYTYPAPDCMCGVPNHA